MRVRGAYALGKGIKVRNKSVAVLDIRSSEVCAAVGDEVIGIEQKTYKGHWAEVILHAHRDGCFQELRIDEKVRPYVEEMDLWVQAGDRVDAFRGANDSLGTLVLRFDSQAQLEESLTAQQEWLHVEVNE